MNLSLIFQIIGKLVAKQSFVNINGHFIFRIVDSETSLVSIKKVLIIVDHVLSDE